MSDVTKVVVIIYDNYENVLVVQNQKNKSGTPEIWSLLRRDIKGKETAEKCANKAVDHDLNSIIFNLESFKLYQEQDCSVTEVFRGNLKGKTVLHKSLYDLKWINVKELDNYEFKGEDKSIIMSFVEEHRFK